MPDDKITFEEITKDDILKAFEYYDELKKNNQLEEKRKEKKYILFYNSKEYAHKYICGIAYKLHYNKDKILLSDKYYSTGANKNSAEWCLKQHGFELFAEKNLKNV